VLKLVDAGWVVDLYIQPDAAIMGEHSHPTMEERFTMLLGQVGSPCM
jgi:hypothetical protein